MKVILLNGSPHKNGSTHRALKEISDELIANGIEAEIFHPSVVTIPGCIGCRKCHDRKSGKCECFKDDVNVFLEKASQADGFIFGSPVHYAAASGLLTSFLDRAFFAGTSALANKPGACAVVCRRGGASAAFDQINKYMTIANMPVVPSQYWNMVHGNTPEEVEQDLEGLQTMRTLGKNMAWLIKAIEAGKAAGINPPERGQQLRTNFIR